MWLISKANKRLRQYREENNINKMNALQIDELELLSREIHNALAVDCVANNNYYGHAHNLKKYAGIQSEKFLNCVIEHGMNITTRTVNEDEIIHPVSNIISYSQYRKEIFKELTDLNVVVIGPYIAYAEDYYTEERINAIKEKNGRTLLVFPIHGINGADVNYSIESLCKEVERVGRDFQTIMVCLYYRDIQVGMHKEYEKRGYKVVTAGFMYDKFFLNRLRTILRLADAVVGNEFTSGLAYALYLDRPVYVYNQEIAYNNNLSYNFINEKKIDWKVEQEFYEISNDIYFENLKFQKEWGNFYFGLDEVKSRQELKQILCSMVRE